MSIVTPEVSSVETSPAEQPTPPVPTQGPPAPEPSAAVVADLLQRYLASQEPAPVVVEQPPEPAPPAPPQENVALAAVLYDLEVLKAGVPAAAKPYLPKDVDSLRVFLASPEYTTLVTALVPTPVTPAPAVPVPPPGDNAEGVGSGPRTPNFAAIGRRMS